MDRTVTAVLVAAIMAMSCCVLLVSDEGDAATYVAEVGENQYETLAEAYDAAKDSNGTIKLLSDIKLDAELKITNPVTLDLDGHMIYADEGFTKTADDSHNNLISVEYLSSGTVKILNGTLRTGSNNNHVLNIFQANNVELADLLLDHTVSYRGAPLVVNGSKVNLSGSMTFITGTISWYAVNVDNKAGGTNGASLTTAANTELVFKGTNPLAIYIETSPEVSGKVELSFGDGTKAISDIENFTLSSVSSKADTGLVDADTSGVDIVPETEPTPEPIPTPGYDDDEDLPPYIPSQSSNDDDTVTIVACAAAAAVAAILAVFLVIDRK